MDENFRANVRSKLVSYWAILIMISNLIHMQIALGEMKKDLLEQETIGRSLGIATLLSWISLNSYLTFSSEWAVIPNTIVQSSASVLNGIIGFLPFMVGLAMFSTTVLF